MHRSIGRLATIWLALAAMVVPGTAVMAQDARSDRAEAMIEAAREAQQDSDWREAAAAWMEVTERDPDNGAAWFNLGYCLHADRQLEKAIKVHKRAATFEDYEGIALYNLGCAYALTGRSGSAFDALEASMEAGFDVAGSAGGDADLDSLRDDPRFARFVQTRRSGGGQWSIGGGGDDIGAIIGEIFGTIRSFLAENAPKTEGMFLELAQHAAATFNMLQKELANNEQLAPIAEMIGQWMGGGHGSSHGGMSSGHDAHEEEHAHDDDDEDHGHEHADHDDHDHDDTSASRPRSDARPGGDLEALAAMAQRHQQAGEWKAAIKAWKAVLDQQPDIGGAWFNLGYALHASGELEEAVKIHKKAAQFDEFEGIATYNLGCAYALMGKKDKAFAALADALDAGFDLADAMPGDSDLDSLRKDRRYERLLDKAREH